MYKLIPSNYHGKGRKPNKLSRQLGEGGWDGMRVIGRQIDLKTGKAATLFKLFLLCEKILLISLIQVLPETNCQLLIRGAPQIPKARVKLNFAFP